MRSGEVRAGSAGALAGAACRSRADWGADESLRFESDGSETWPPAFHLVQATIVHHTATKNDDPDPAATVRAIYRYHVVDNGWGDIGYQYLVDEAGVVYEGRWSGTASTSCASGGTGVDFGHEHGTDRMVTGAHTGGANSGNLGISLVGTFTTKPRSGAEPEEAAVAALEDVLAELMVRHGLDPQGTVDYVNPVDGSTKAGVPTISGHRDWGSTECPGARLYDRLPTIRSAVAAKMAPADAAPTVQLVSPADGAVLRGDVVVSAEAVDDVGVQSVEFLVDGVAVGQGSLAEGVWSLSWSSASVTDGAHEVSAVASDGAGQTGGDTAPVTVDNVAEVEVHVADLDGVGLKVRNQREAAVTVTAHSGTTPVEGATVTGSWGDGSLGTCTTGSGGTCQVVSSRLTKGTASTTYTVSGVAAGGHTYDPAANTDPEPDSDGTTITVVRPA